MAFRRQGITPATRAGARGGTVVDGVDALVREFAHKATTIHPEAGATVVEIAGRAAQEMRDTVAVDEGDVHDSITADDTPTPTPAGVYAEAGPEHFVARFLENGTVKMSPRPFVGPVADRMVTELGDALEQLGDL